MKYTSQGFLTTDQAELQRHIADVERNGINTRGKTEYLKYLRGGKLTRKEAMLARCYDCMGYFVDGRADCMTPSCPMYSFMIFRNTKGDRTQGRDTE